MNNINIKPDFLIINGMGKCGTRLLHGFLCGYYRRAGFLVDITQINNIKLRNHSIIKTHSPYPIKQCKYNIKVVFMFGNIYNTVISFYKGWEEKFGGYPNPLAATNLFMTNANKNKSPIENDIFRYKRHFDNWYKSHKYPVLFVRYETMYDHIGEILDFCGLKSFPVEKFPKYKQRTTNWLDQPEPIKERLVKLYGSLDEYINQLPDIKEMNVI